MLFCSEAYLLFFSIVFLLYWACPWHRARVWLLLVSSFGFYASWNHWLALLILVSATVDYALALAIESSSTPNLRKGLLAINVVSNLGLLCYFKYMNFFLESLQASLSALGAQTSIPLLSVILPVGISFYTFEAISYVIDVYRGKAPAERSLAHFLLFITFFPHLVAGPIVRARDFLPQIARPKHWDWARLNLGAQYFLMGMFKKLAIADRMAAFVDPIYQNPDAYSTHNAWLAVAAYTMQVYCDFSGYTDMAIGSAHMLGYKLAPNFNMPFLASNISDFWRRWHISLSSWIRDYLFIPLGGSRHGEWITQRNLFITMTLAGLWHGNRWNFVVHGMLMGLLLVGHRQFRLFAEKRPLLERFLATPIVNGCCVALTVFSFGISLVIFRAQTLAQAGAVFEKLFVYSPGTLPTPLHATALLYALLIMAISHWIGTRVWFQRGRFELPAPVAGLGYAMQLSLTLLLAPVSGQAFIYFQF